MVLKIDRR
jgi:hypothetical protein